MAFTGSSDLYVVELVIYLLLFPVTVYLGYCHGAAGFLGYFYLNVTCAIFIAADIVSILPANRDATHPTIATAVLSSIGLSPLMLALAGFVHEVHVRVVEATPRTTGQVKRLKAWLWFAQLQIHGVAIIGIVLAIVGNVKLAAPPAIPLTHTQKEGDEHLRSAGALLLFLLWIGLVQYILIVTRAAHKIRAQHLPTAVLVVMKQMTVWILLAAPFIGVRCAYWVVYTFDHTNAKLNPITGSLWVKVVFVFLPTLGAVTCMCLSGSVSRNLSKPGQANRVYGSDENGHYVGVDASRKS